MPFAGAFVTLTSLMLFNQIRKQLPQLRAAAAPTATILKVFALSVPFIVALTLPMAVLMAVLRVFTGRQGNREVLALERVGVTPMRFAAVVLAGATLVGACALAWNDQVVPWSNHHLRTLLVEIEHPGSATPSESETMGDREMSTGQLRRVARSAGEEAQVARAEGNAVRENAARQRGAAYAVEIQKKYAVSAACVVFALFAVGLGLRIRWGGWPLVIGISWLVFTLQYVGLIGGEELGDRLIVSPFVAMWTPNLVMAVLGCGLLWSINKSAGTTLARSVPPA